MLPIIKRNEQNWMTNWFNDFFSEGWPTLRSAAVSEPAINIAEDDQHYHIELAAPGRSKEDFQVSVTDHNTLLVVLEQKDEKTEKPCEKDDCKYLRREFNYHKFEQQLLLPEDVDRKGITAKMKHGVLRITLPKLAPDHKTALTQAIAIE